MSVIKSINFTLKELKVVFYVCNQTKMELHIDYIIK
jgi:hypothetical protein